MVTPAVADDMICVYPIQVHYVARYSICFFFLIVIEGADLKGFYIVDTTMSILSFKKLLL